MNMRQRRRTMIAQSDRFVDIPNGWFARAMGFDSATRKFWDITMPRWKAGERRRLRHPLWRVQAHLEAAC